MNTNKPPAGRRRRTRKDVALRAFIDVTLCVLFVYMTQTQWIEDAHSGDNRELMLPPVDLTDMKSHDDAGFTGRHGSLLIVSLSVSGGRVSYHQGDQALDWNGLSAAFASAGSREVVLRIDDDVRQGDVMKVMGLARDQGVMRVSHAFNERHGGK